MTRSIEDISDLNFSDQVLASEQPYLLNFSGAWCAPCKALEPILETVADQCRGRLRTGKIDLDSSPAIAARFGVRGAPTLILFRDGKEVGRRLGLTNRENLLKFAGM